MDFDFYEELLLRRDESHVVVSNNNDSLLSTACFVYMAGSMVLDKAVFLKTVYHASDSLAILVFVDFLRVVRQVIGRHSRNLAKNRSKASISDDVVIVYHNADYVSRHIAFYWDTSSRRGVGNRTADAVQTNPRSNTAFLLACVTKIDVFYND